MFTAIKIKKDRDFIEPALWCVSTALLGRCVAEVGCVVFCLLLLCVDVM